MQTEKNGKQKKDKNAAVDTAHSNASASTKQLETQVAEPDATKVAPSDEQDTTMKASDLSDEQQAIDNAPVGNEWQEVGKAHRASPRCDAQKSVTGRDARTNSPSRYQVLKDMEEGELESSSSDEEDAESSDLPPQEVKTSSKDGGKTKTTSRNRAGANNQGQNDKKKSAKPTKTKNASNRRH